MLYRLSPPSVARAIVALATAHCLCAQPPAVSKEAQGLAPRAAPTDYQVQAKAGSVTIAAEFTGHGIPTSQSPLTSEDYVAVELGLFGPADARLVISAADFSLKVNGKKTAMISQPFGLVAKNIKDPDWVPPEAPEKKSKGSMGGSGGAQGDGNPPPVTPKVPIELLRGWQQRLQKAALPEGDRALPQAGLLFSNTAAKPMVSARWNCSTPARRAPPRSPCNNAGAGNYCAVHPPSTSSVWPVIIEAAGEARNTTAPATSTGWPTRCSAAMRRSTSARNSGLAK